MADHDDHFVWLHYRHRQLGKLSDTQFSLKEAYSQYSSLYSRRDSAIEQIDALLVRGHDFEFELKTEFQKYKLKYPRPLYIRYAVARRSEGLM